MKRAAFVVILIFALATVAGAQEFEKGITAKGVKFGLNTSNFTNTGGLFTTRTGLGIGVFATYSLSPHFAIQPELLYMQKGTSWGFFIDVDWPANYLEVPILAKVTAMPQKTFQPCLFVGPALGILLSSSVTVEYDGETDLDVDVTEGMNSTDFSFVFGGGFALKFTSFTVTLDVRYTIGLTDFLDAQKINALAYPDDPDRQLLYEDPDSQNSCMSILWGVSF